MEYTKYKQIIQVTKDIGSGHTYKESLFKVLGKFKNLGIRSLQQGNIIIVQKT